MKPIDELSLGWRTDLIFPRFDAEVIERSGYLLVRTPHNPNFWWGNFLLFDHAPAVRESAQWLAQFEAEIASRQRESRHIAFGIDTLEPFEMPAELVAAGFTRDAGTVLTMRREQLRPPIASFAPMPPGCRIGVLDLPAQAGVAVELQIICDQGEHPPPHEYRLFRQRQMQRYAAMERAGLGHWFGVFAATDQGEQLVADCGLFRESAPRPTTTSSAARGRMSKVAKPHLLMSGTLGRFQHVETHPQWRRRGLCRALIHAVCAHGFEAMGLHSLVIVADPDDVAIGLYESVGFERGPSTWHLQRAPDIASA
jgi:RimJ/RimL family protein N-acetyltransferase